MSVKPDTYEDFAAWRDARTSRQTMGDAMRCFSLTSIETLTRWWERHDIQTAEAEWADLEAMRAAVQA